MDSGFYMSTAGMASEMSALSVLSNNLANANTPGYKEDFETLLRQASNGLSYGMGGLVRSTGILDTRTQLDLTQGSLTNSTSPLDVALTGPGFFCIQSPTGVTYTRDGRFHLSPTGQLTGEDGGFVLDVAGRPIQLPDPQGQDIKIRPDGTINIGATNIGQIGVYNASAWTKNGNGQYSPVGGTATPISTTLMQQNMLETANVNVSTLMGSLMSIERSFEAASQLQKQSDQIQQQAVNDIAKF
jgi:flagellar basal-body rod protein FlgF